MYDGQYAYHIDRSDLVEPWLKDCHADLLLLDRIHDDHRVVSDRTIDTLVKSVRKKINAVYSEQVLIHSVYAMGYKFDF